MQQHTQICALREKWSIGCYRNIVAVDKQRKLTTLQLFILTTLQLID